MIERYHFYLFLIGIGFTVNYKINATISPPDVASCDKLCYIVVGYWNIVLIIIRIIFFVKMRPSSPSTVSAEY